MANNLAIDYILVESAQKIGGFRTKRETVTRALEEFIQRRKAQDPISLLGKIVYDPAYDYKSSGAVDHARCGF